MPAGTDHMTSGSWSKVLPVHEELWKFESLMKNGIGGESVQLGHWCDLRVRRSRCDDLNPRTTEITHDRAKWKQGQRLPQGYRKETKSLHHLCPKSVTNKELSSSVSRRKLSAERLLSVRTWSARMFRCQLCQGGPRSFQQDHVKCLHFIKLRLANNRSTGPSACIMWRTTSKDAAYQRRVWVCECTCTQNKHSFRLASSLPLCMHII